MKTIKVCVAALMLFVAGVNFSAYAEVTRNGNTFKVTRTVSANEDVESKFKWETADGIELPVYRTKNGSYYIIRTSKKTGKAYKQYLPKETQEVMRKEEGIVKKK